MELYRSYYTNGKWHYRRIQEYKPTKVNKYPTECNDLGDRLHYTKDFDFYGQAINYIKKVEQSKKVTSWGVSYTVGRKGMVTLTYTINK